MQSSPNCKCKFKLKFRWKLLGDLSKIYLYSQTKAVSKDADRDGYKNCCSNNLHIHPSILDHALHWYTSKHVPEISSNISKCHRFGKCFTLVTACIPMCNQRVADIGSTSFICGYWLETADFTAELGSKCPFQMRMVKKYCSCKNKTIYYKNTNRNKLSK